MMSVMLAEESFSLAVYTEKGRGECAGRGRGGEVRRSEVGSLQRCRCIFLVGGTLGDVVSTEFLGQGLPVSSMSRAFCQTRTSRKDCDSSDVQVLDVEGVVLDELAAGRDFVAHEEGEEGVGLGGVVDARL
jgi:hypothetical protein